MKPFSKETIEQARNINLVGYLNAAGVPLLKDGSQYRLKEHDSLVINPENNLWKWNSRDIGGKNAIDYLEKVENMNFIEAVSSLIGERPYIQPFSPAGGKKKQKSFCLPCANENNKRVFAYLHRERCILPEIINHFIKSGDLYEDKEHHNAVFVGRDEKGVPRYANKRSTSTFTPKVSGKGKKVNTRWDVESSDKSYGFKYVGTSDRVFVFEAPIDMLSYISLRLIAGTGAWKNDSYISLGGKSDIALSKFLEMHPNIHRIIFCLDNDYEGREKDGTPANWGQMTADSYIEKYGKKGYTAKKHVPGYGKDFNDMQKAVTNGSFILKTVRRG